MESATNLFDLPAASGDTERFDILAEGNGMYIERIISNGQATPVGEWFDQKDDEWVALLQGDAELRFANGRTHQLTAGDYLFIPAHELHRVERTSTSPPCVWLAVHIVAGAIQPDNA